MNTISKRVFEYVTVIFIVTYFGCNSPNGGNNEKNNEPMQPSAQSIADDQYIPIVVVLFDDTVFNGSRRYLITDCSDFYTTLAFNDITSSVTVHKGPNYHDFKARFGKEPTVSFYQHSLSGNVITLQVGSYVSMSSYNINDQISSAQFFTDISSTIPPDSPETNYDFNQIRLVTRFWQCSFSGWCMTIISTGNDSIDNISSFSATFGGGLDNQASSLTVTKGPSWYSNTAIRCYTNDNYSGGYGQYQAGASVGFLGAFNDQFSSATHLAW